MRVSWEACILVNLLALAEVPWVDAANAEPPVPSSDLLQLDDIAGFVGDCNKDDGLNLLQMKSHVVQAREGNASTRSAEAGKKISLPSHVQNHANFNQTASKANVVMNGTFALQRAEGPGEALDAEKITLAQIGSNLSVAHGAPGHEANAQPQAAGRPGKSKTFLLILEFFGFGFLGIDRLYLGQIKIGIVKLFTLAGFGIWGAADYIVVLNNALRKYDSIHAFGMHAAFSRKSIHPSFYIGVIMVVLLLQGSIRVLSDTLRTWQSNRKQARQESYYDNARDTMEGYVSDDTYMSDTDRER